MDPQQRLLLECLGRGKHGEALREMSRKTSSPFSKLLPLLRCLLHVSLVFMTFCKREHDHVGVPKNKLVHVGTHLHL